MAACDNLYGNRKEWNELHAFLFQTKPLWIEKYMRKQPTEEDGEVRICYIADIQDWLIENCPLVWVQDRLKGNFDIQRLILGKAHHEDN
jgi:hypothetical protein